MDIDYKKKNRKGKCKFRQIDSSLEEETKNQKPSNVRSISLQSDLRQKRISLHSSNYIPTKVSELGNIIKLEKIYKKKDDNYYEITSKSRNDLKTINDKIIEEYLNRNKLLKFLKEIELNKNLEDKRCVQRIREISREREIIELLKKDIDKLKIELEDSETIKKGKKIVLENKDTTKKSEILQKKAEIEKERNNVTFQENQNKELKNKIPEILKNISQIEEEINEQKNIINELRLKKDQLKENFSKINKTAMNDNKFCHENFFASLPLFPYYKNVAFISTENNNKNSIINETTDENRIIIDEELLEDIENKDFNYIKYLLKQKDESKKVINYKILDDRRTLQFNPKEKYKFNKIFSIINNHFIAEPWDSPKFFSFKLSTINSYFNEFNMTAISNNYFIIYFVPVLDKSCLKGEFYSLYQQLKNNEYIDKYITIKISAISESNYINLQNINQENNIKAQIETINASGLNTIYGFLYEFIKSNRLNKKNIFRIYSFDYSYPQAIEMMNNITKFYAKKKRKKTGVYKKVIRQGGPQVKAKKKQADKTANNLNNISYIKNNKSNNNINKVNINNPAKKKNNVNKIVQFKKSVITNNNKKKNSSKNNINNRSFISNNKSEKKKDNKKILNINSLDSKKILKKTGSSQRSLKKEKNFKINSKNNIKYVKIDDKTKSITPKKINSANKELVAKKTKINNIVFNDLKSIKPEHTLIIHDIDEEFVKSDEFKKIAKACGILYNIEK